MAEIRLSLREANGDLPKVCLVCGRDNELVKKKTFAWQPPWVWVALLLGVLPFAIIALILTKRATVQAPLCKEHRFHWDGRILGIFFGSAWSPVPLSRRSISISIPGFGSLWPPSCLLGPSWPSRWA